MSYSTSDILQIQSSRGVYFDLFCGHADEHQSESAREFLREQLSQAAQLEADLPADHADLYAWMQADVETVGRKYQEYLEGREAGGPRRYFSSKTHALYFLKSVAPTKMVDGAWLYGLLPRWQDNRFRALIQTYLEELGEGSPKQNHVVLFKKLLAKEGLENWEDLTDEHYIQGAIQVSLAYNAEHFLPEVIGFNLGYEQLPLHLLITAYELKELGIDPYYFTLHITVDNADSGHAKKAVDSVFEALPRLGDVDEWYRRICNGYKLNLLGANTNSVIESFDLEREVVSIFARKGAVGQFAHSNYRQIGGRTINDWLSDPALVPAFLAAMEKENWIKRHQDPNNSRFWKLIQSDSAKMYGVFSAYEQQVIYDWIAGDAVSTLGIKTAGRPLSPAARQMLDGQSKSQAHSDDDFDAEERELEAKLAAAPSSEAAMETLIGLMSPADHHSAPGLMATRVFNEMMG